MTILYSDVPPLRIPTGGEGLQAYFQDQAMKADSIIIASGYASKNSLIELDRIARTTHLKKMIVVLGMYYIEGCPESIYNTAMKLHEQWQADGIGEIRLIRSMKYHAKVYAFYKAKQIVSSIVGSNNLGSITKDAGNIRQYELAFASTDADTCQGIDEHLSKVIKEPISIPISDAADLNIIHEENQKLVGVEGVSKVGDLDVLTYKMSLTDISFDLPLKVPGMPNTSQDYMKSNVNKCYAAPRNNTTTGVGIERGWWETELIVSKKITSLPTYPEKGVPFYVVTDDGWMFRAHVSGDYKKNFESDLDLKVLGYWLKGRIVTAGLVEPVDSPSADLANKMEGADDVYQNCKGVITYQMLVKYGRTSVTLTKTTKKYTEDDGTVLDVWFLSFLPANVK